MRFLFLFCIFGITFAESFNNGIVPVNVQGYITNVDTRTTADFAKNKIQNAHKQGLPMHPNLQKMQAMYLNPLTYNIDVELYNSPSVEQTYIEGVKSTKHKPKQEKFTTDAVKMFCKEIGYSENSTREAMQFYNCMNEVMKTKFTEETLKNTKYETLDVHLPRGITFQTPIDAVVANFVQYKEMISERNKLDCLNEQDYYKCLSAITKFKKCHNQSVAELRNHSMQNRVICYTKTSIRFPSPKLEEIHIRDSYFSVCNHLIQETLKEKIISNNKKCNQILTKNNLLHLAV